MALNTWLLYVAAVFVLTVTPGPSVLMCMTLGVQHGARRTLFAALGSVSAVVGIMGCSAVGLGVALAASETLFGLLKWLGVAYLLYIGVTTFRSTETNIAVPESVAAKSVVSLRALYVKGLLVGASNPKALLFFTAFFPQFIDPAAPQLPQFLVMVATFVGFELFWLMFYATFAARLAPWLRATGRATLFNRLSGGTFVAASVLLATVKRVEA